MFTGNPLYFGFGIWAYLALLALLVIPSIVSGIIISLITLPVMYLTGYGFVPLHRTPAYGEDFQTSAVLHTKYGTLIFGAAMFGSLLSSEFLSEGPQLPILESVNGGQFITVVILTVGVIWTLLQSKPNGKRLSSPRSLLILAGIWYGYPILLIVLFILLLVLTGVGTYQLPSWVH